MQIQQTVDTQARLQQQLPCQMHVILMANIPVRAEGARQTHGLQNIRAREAAAVGPAQASFLTRPA